jgi:hypothetical protein
MTSHLVVRRDLTQLEKTMESRVNIERDKSEISLRVDEEIDTTFNPNKWTTKEALILTARILASNGHFEGLAGQCTARGPKEGTYWTFRLGIGFDEATQSGNALSYLGLSQTPRCKLYRSYPSSGIVGFVHDRKEFCRGSYGCHPVL